jgi:hypothetical protein
MRKESLMGPHAVDLPDPFEDYGDAPGDALLGDGNDELISRLAGDDVERLMGGHARVGPVQELTSQLDNFFEELRQRQTQTIQALARQEQGGLVIDEAERQALVGDLGGDLDRIDSPLAMHQAFVDPDPRPAWYARPLDWCGGMIESLSPGARIVVNITAVLSFLAACAVLAYVLILRQA